VGAGGAFTQLALVMGRYSSAGAGTEQREGREQCASVAWSGRTCRLWRSESTSQARPQR
jgi:hypothetical protein